MRKHMLYLLCMLVALCAATSAQSQPASTTVQTASVVPNLVKFNGTAKDADGKPLSGVVGITFALYQEEQGGASLWMETQNVHADTAGRYNVSLGTEKLLPVELFRSGEARWLGVQVGEQKEQARVLLLSVPYALKAADAETLGGLAASAFLRAPKNSELGSGPQTLPPTVHGNGSIGYVPLWTAKNIIDKSSLFQSGLNVGIGTTAPSALLDINGASNIRSTLTLFPNGNAPTVAISGTAFSVNNAGIINFAPGQTFPGGGGGSITGVTAGTDLTGGGTSGNVTLNLDTTKVPQLGAANLFTQPLTINSTNQVAVRATSSASSASVIYGHSTDTSGAGSQGVLGIADGPSGVGTQGYSSGASGIGVEGNGKMSGVLGFSTAPSAMWNTFSTVGVHGDTGVTNGVGVLGTVDSGNAVGGIATIGVGVYGKGSNDGVFGVTNTPGGNGVLGMSLNGTAVNGDDQGSGTGVMGASASGIGVQGTGVSAGVYGVTTASGGSANGVRGASTNATAVRGDDAGSGSGAVGTSASGYGVFGSSPNGFSFGADNNTKQARGAGGWVKAMVLVDPFAPGGIAIIRCFNSQQTGAAVYTAPCGMTLVSHRLGDNILDFGFQVSDRFPSATSATSAAAISATAVGTNQVEVLTVNPISGNLTDVPFYLFEY